MLYLRWVFRDKTSWAVFITTFLLTLYGFKVLPGNTKGETLTLLQAVLGIIYAFLFSLVGTCLFKSLKEKLKEALREKKTLGFLGEFKENLKKGLLLKALKGFLLGTVKLFAVFTGILGLGAAQFCAFGSPVCGFSVGAAIVTALFPAFLVEFLYRYANFIVFAAIVLQVAGLYFMGCFKRVKVLERA